MFTSSESENDALPAGNVYTSSESENDALPAGNVFTSSDSESNIQLAADVFSSSDEEGPRAVDVFTSDDEGPRAVDVFTSSDEEEPTAADVFPASDSDSDGIAAGDVFNSSDEERPRAADVFTSLDDDVPTAADDFPQSYSGSDGHSAVDRHHGYFDGGDTLEGIFSPDSSYGALAANVYTLSSDSDSQHPLAKEAIRYIASEDNKNLPVINASLEGESVSQSFIGTQNSPHAEAEIIPRIPGPFTPHFFSDVPDSWFNTVLNEEEFATSDDEAETL